MTRRRTTPSDLAARVKHILAGMDYPWFVHAGKPMAGVRVPTDLEEAWDGSWDGWNHKSHKRRAAARRRLEKAAQRDLGDKTIDRAFGLVGKALGPTLWDALGAYLDRVGDPYGVGRGIAIELFDYVMCDLCWVVVERLMKRKGFFSTLLPWFARGRLLCGWMRDKPVVL
jgi:hypothetical protein